MISMNFNSYASLAIFFIFVINPVLLCFVYKQETLLKLEPNYGTWHVPKLLYGSSVATCHLTCSEISHPINEKKLERSLRKGQQMV